MLKCLSKFCELLGHKSLLLKTSQFGATSSVIGGYMIAYLCGQHMIGNTTKYSPAKHHDIFRNTGVLIIDDYSLIDRKCLKVLDQAMRSAKGCESNIPFGGVDVLFVGDCFQLPPVGSRMLHDPRGRRDERKIFTRIFRKSSY